MKNETAPLHLAFAKERDKKKQERDVILRRCVASLYWCHEYFDAVYWAVPDFDESDLEGDGCLASFDDPQAVLDATLRLKASSMKASEITTILNALSTDDMERAIYSTEISCGQALVAIKMNGGDGDGYEKAHEEVIRGCSECPDCEKAVYWLLLSHITHQETLPYSAFAHLAHSGDDLMAQELNDTLLFGLDHAHTKAMEAEAKGGAQ